VAEILNSVVVSNWFLTSSCNYGAKSKSVFLRPDFSHEVGLLVNVNHSPFSITPYFGSKVTLIALDNEATPHSKLFPLDECFASNNVEMFELPKAKVILPSR
jgi:hypothetical protein